MTTRRELSLPSGRFITDVTHGTVICDMHYGLEIPDGWEVVRRYEINAVGGSDLIQKNVSKWTGKPYLYLNKCLVIWGSGWDGSIHCAYSYDDHRIGFIDIIEKESK
tara:strand:- start:371 stop:691 length:321 start_codon:yes stop_codon:yes gene_type:complete